MNNRVLQTISLFLCLFLFTLNAHSASTIAIVDADMIVQKSSKGKALFDEIRRFTEGKKSEVEAKVKAFQDKQKALQARAASMTEAGLQDARHELEGMQLDIKRFREDAEREQQSKLNQGLDTIRKDLAPLIRQVALENGYDAVFNYGPQSNLVFFSSSIDITDLVVRKYDQMQ